MIASWDGEGERHVLHLEDLHGEIWGGERCNQHFFPALVDPATLYVKSSQISQHLDKGGEREERGGVGGKERDLAKVSSSCDSF